MGVFIALDADDEPYLYADMSGSGNVDVLIPLADTDDFLQVVNATAGVTVAKLKVLQASPYSTFIRLADSTYAIEADLFQVVVSPHHNDAHNNHVHLEVRPEVTWRSIQ